MCSGFFMAQQRRQEARETQTLELKEFASRAERLSEKLRGCRYD